MQTLQTFWTPAHVSHHLTHQTALDSYVCLLRKQTLELTFTGSWFLVFCVIGLVMCRMSVS